MMIRNGYARRLQAQAERSRLTEQWQAYPEPVRQLLQALLRDHGLAAAQRATKALVEYAASSEAADHGLSRDWKQRVQRGGDLKGTFHSFSLQGDSESLLAPGHVLVVDADFEMVHLMGQSYPPLVLSQRCNDVELAIILPLLRAWPASTDYGILYTSLCLASWEGTFREFRRYLPILLNDCVQRLSYFGMEVKVDGSSLQLVPCP